MRYRVCSIRGELRNPQDKGTDSLMEAVNKAESIVNGGRCFPGLSVWEWTNGQLAAIVKPGSTEFVEHGA
jgi:hypothetical protein